MHGNNPFQNIQIKLPTLVRDPLVLLKVKILTNGKLTLNFCLKKLTHFLKMYLCIKNLKVLSTSNLDFHHDTKIHSYKNILQKHCHIKYIKTNITTTRINLSFVSTFEEGTFNTTKMITNLNFNWGRNDLTKNIRTRQRIFYRQIVNEPKYLQE